MWMLGQENKARAPTWGGGEGVGKSCWAPWPKVLHINSSWFHYYPSLIRSFLIPGRFVCVCVCTVNSRAFWKPRPEAASSLTFSSGPGPHFHPHGFGGWIFPEAPLVTFVVSVTCGLEQLETPYPHLRY